jgi:hypothetical protein
VQLKRGDAWADLDPLTADGSLASAGLAPVETIDVDTSSPLKPIKLEDSHRLKVSVIVEALNGGQLKQEVALEHTFRPADVLGTAIVLRHNLMDGKDLLTAGGDPKKSMAIAAEHKKWLPILWVGNSPYTENGFDAAGQLSKAADMDPAGKLSGAAGNAMGGMMGGLGGGDSPEAAGHLTAEWIEYTVLVPGAEPTTVRREIFDLLGPAARAAGGEAVKSFAATDLLKARRGFALRGNVEMLPMVSRIAPEFIDHLSAKAMLANGPAMVADLRRPNGSKPVRTLPAPIPSGALIDLARVRFESSPNAGRLFLDRPNVLAYQQQFTLKDKDTVSVTQGFDIVANDLAARPALTGQELFAARLQQGVLETNAEDLLMRRVAPGATMDAGNAATVMSRAVTAGQAPVCIRTAEELSKLSAASPDTAARMKEALSSGCWVIAAAGSGDGWYRLDPRSGTVLGIGSRGWGAALTEDQLLRILIAEENMGFCLEGQIFRIHVQQREGAALGTTLLVCAVAAGATFFLESVTVASVIFGWIGGLAAGLSAS